MPPSAVWHKISPHGSQDALLRPSAFCRQRLFHQEPPITGTGRPLPHSPLSVRLYVSRLTRGSRPSPPPEHSASSMPEALQLAPSEAIVSAPWSNEGLPRTPSRPTSEGPDPSPCVQSRNHPAPAMPTEVLDNRDSAVVPCRMAGRTSGPVAPRLRRPTHADEQHDSVSRTQSPSVARRAMVCQ